MSSEWQPFVELVEKHKHFLLTTHVRPDGDALGSEKAMAAALRRRGKQVRIANSSPMPARYAFMDPAGECRQFTPPGDELRDSEVLIILDTGTWSQLATMADFVRSLPARKVVIDHHVTQDDLGAIRFVNTSAEANARRVREAIAALGVPLDAEIAVPLYVGLAMDTGWFRHSNTTAESFVLAAELVRAGVNPESLYQELFERNTLARLKLTGMCLNRLTTLAGGRLAYTSIRQRDLQEAGAVPPDTEDLVNFTLSLTGVEIGLFFFEQAKGGVKVSFRSRGDIDVRALAEQFGGGGHRQAAGGTVQGTLDEAIARVVQSALTALQLA